MPEHRIESEDGRLPHELEHGELVELVEALAAEVKHLSDGMYAARTDRITALATMFKALNEDYTGKVSTGQHQRLVLRALKAELES